MNEKIDGIVDVGVGEMKGTEGPPGIHSPTSESGPKGFPYWDGIERDARGNPVRKNHMPFWTKLKRRGSRRRCA